MSRTRTARCTSAGRSCCRSACLSLLAGVPCGSTVRCDSGLVVLCRSVVLASWQRVTWRVVLVRALGVVSSSVLAHSFLPQCYPIILISLACFTAGHGRAQERQADVHRHRRYSFPFHCSLSCAACAVGALLLLALFVACCSPCLPCLRFALRLSIPLPTALCDRLSSQQSRPTATRFPHLLFVPLQARTTRWLRSASTCSRRSRASSSDPASAPVLPPQPPLTGTGVVALRLLLLEAVAWCRRCRCC